MSEVMDAYWQAPPISRTLTTATLFISLSVYIGFLPSEWFYFSPWLLFKLPPHIWRPATCFLLTGPQLSLFFDTYFLYHYLSAVEVGNPRLPRREDVLWYLIFVGGVIITLCSYLFGGGFFLNGLILALCRTVTQDQRGMKASFYFITIPAQLMPFGMMLVSLLFPGGIYMVKMQLTGFFAAHAYDFLSRIYPEFSGAPNLIPTPGFLSRLMGTPRVYQRSYGTAIRTTSQEASGSSTGASLGSGPLPDSWKSRGAGRRLGD